MDLYKVMLVDDEEDVRRSIVNKLDWASLGFEVAGEASNGEEALELVERLEPDVVMTDIKMPFMDGLELCRQIKRLYPGVRVAVFSGFDEFEYAKEAITQQVEEYILKPIDAAELADVFRRLRASLDEEIARRRDFERLQQHYEQSLPLMRQQLLTDLLDGRLQAEALAGQLADCQLDLRAEAYCVAAVRCEQDEAMSDRAALVQLSLHQLIRDNLEPVARYYTVSMADRIMLLFLLDGGQSAKWVAGLLDRLFPICKRLLGIRLSIGVGGARQQAGRIALSCREALSALEYQLLVEPGQCIYIGDIEPGAASGTALDVQFAENVVRQIKIGGPDELREAVGEMIRHLKSAQTSLEQVQIYLLELFTELLKLIRTYRMDPAEARQNELLVDGTAFRIATMEELGEWLFAYCDNLRVIARRERKDSVRTLIEKAKDLLQYNYANPELSLDWVCVQLNVSPAYFSTVFKKETGQGFVGYLTALRMQKALDLLATSDLKTYQIAEQIGYTDPNYFSYVFKKQFGAAPSKYKTDRMKEHAHSSDITAGEA